MTSATCPFCGLLCDDLTLERRGDALDAVSGACPLSRAQLESVSSPVALDRRCMVDGEEATLTEAVDRAAAILRDARRPMIGGLAVDVEDMRATLTLARQLGATIDHGGGAAGHLTAQVAREAGWICTTLSEARNRTDLWLLIGAGWHTRFPRFVERVLDARERLADAASPVRVVLLDDVAARHADALPQRCERLALNATPEDLPLLLSLLSALAANRPVASIPVGNLDPARVAHSIEWIRAACYGTVVWCNAEMQLPHADLTLHALARLLRTLNRKGRFAALPLASPDGGLTANAVHTWQTGSPLPASHANGSVAFDASRYALDAVLARIEADALLWVSSLSAELRPPGFAGPVVVLGRCDMKLTIPPRVFIPVATTGIDAPGVLTRTDDVVSLYLRAARERHLAPAATVLGMLSERIAAT